MANLIPRRRSKSKKERAAQAAGNVVSSAGTIIKARIAWLAGKKATKVAAPAVAVGTAAVVAKKRLHRSDTPEATVPQTVDATPTPAAAA
jgi:hypothetical protein